MTQVSPIELCPHLGIGVEEIVKDPLPWLVKWQVPLVHHDPNIGGPRALGAQDAIPGPPQIQLPHITKLRLRLKSLDQGHLLMGAVASEQLEAAGHHRVPSISPDNDRRGEGLRSCI
jgi:hypothetical protein